MSIQAVAWVLENSRSRGTARLVLIALANHASEENDWCAWPAARTLAREAGVASHATALTAIERLAALGELKVVDHGDARHPGRYRVMFMDAQWSDSDHSSGRETTAAVSPDEPLRSAQTDQNRKEPEGTVTAATAAPSSRGSSKSAVKERANALTCAWWETREPRPLQPFVAVRKIIEGALRAGHDSEAIMVALRRIQDDPPIVTWKLEKALAAARPKPRDPAGLNWDR